MKRNCVVTSNIIFVVTVRDRQQYFISTEKPLPNSIINVIFVFLHICRYFNCVTLTNLMLPLQVTPTNANMMINASRFANSTAAHNSRLWFILSFNIEKTRFYAMDYQFLTKNIGNSGDRRI